MVIILPAILKLVCSFQSRYINTFHITHHSKRSALSTSIDIKCRQNIEKEDDWDEELQQEAAAALLPVFFPDCADKPVTAEVALKRLLRKKYSQRQHSNQSSNTTTTSDQNKSMNESRARLAELILGTSVMRLRHFVVAAVEQGTSTTFPLPHPFIHAELSPYYVIYRLGHG